MLRRYFMMLIFLFGTVFSLAAQANTVQALLHQPGDPIAGNPQGDITLVEFFDYQCSHCVNMAGVIANIMRNNPDIKIIFKEFPIRGPLSEFSAKAALAANMQGKYYPFSHALLTANEPITSEADVLAIAKQQNLNMTKLQKDMNGKTVNTILRNNAALAETLNISGTPAFAVAKSDATDPKAIQVTLGELSQGELQSFINQARS